MNIVLPDVAAARSRGWLATLDPAVGHPAAAVFYNGVLVAASRVKLPGSLKELPEGERERQIAAHIVAWITHQTRGARVDHFVYERPQIYTREKSKGNPNELMKLALVAAGVATWLGAPTYAPTPFEWIGNIPKDTRKGCEWTSARGELTRRRLTDAEILAVIVSHDAVDAAALGLHALGRLGKTYSST